MSLTLKLVAVSLSWVVAVSTNDYRTADIAQISEEPAEHSLRELDMFRSVGFSATDAIKVAENRVTGGKVVDVSFDGQADTPLYRVKVYRSGQIWMGLVNALTHRLTDEGIEKPDWSLNDIDKTELSSYGRANISLSDAIAVAEKDTSGKAVGAGLAEENGRFSFSVVVLADGRLVRIFVADK